MSSVEGATVSMSGDMEWLNTTGGPFVCGARSVARNWKGVFGKSKPGDETDYERACLVEGLLGLVECGSGQLLILGDEPMQSAMFVNAAGQVCIARWNYCDIADPAMILPEVHEFSELVPPIAFELASEDFVILDSSETLADANDLERNAFRMSAGQYIVTCEAFEIPGRLSFFFHRFLLSSR